MCHVTDVSHTRGVRQNVGDGGKAGQFNTVLVESEYSVPDFTKIPDESPTSDVHQNPDEHQASDLHDHTTLKISKCFILIIHVCLQNLKTKPLDKLIVR